MFAATPRVHIVVHRAHLHGTFELGKRAPTRHILLWILTVSAGGQILLLRLEDLRALVGFISQAVLC